MDKEKLFYKALKDMFVGVEIEGQCGFANLSRIKSKYYEKMEELLKEDIEEVLKRYPSFRDELFDKLYLFFSSCFTGNGSICFKPTDCNNVYEKNYTNDRDVVLFWKTQPFYYVKTDKIFRSMSVEFNNFKFYFDASSIEGKKNNEKRNLVYELKEIKEDGTIVFKVHYKEGNESTKIDEILNEIKSKIKNIEKKDLEKAFRIFKKQPELDFFIYKNAKAFLQEQFKLWSYQYFWEDSKEWTPDRVNQVQILKNVAFRIIDLISQFEDELVKIWNKPKFVKNSNYVITLDRIAKHGEKGLEVIGKILNHPNLQEQIREWKELGIVDDSFRMEEILDEDGISERYQFLPIDTKYFKDLELKIIRLFDNLDQDLDGWLIKSENYQALNTILPKFKGKVRTIYIDPPYNTGNDGFIYSDKFFHSTWLSFMHDRLSLAKELMRDDGVIFTSIGDLNPQEGESFRLQFLQSMIFPKRFGNLIWKKRNGIGSFSEKNLTENHEYITVFGNEKAFIYKNIITEKQEKEYKHKDERGQYKWMGLLGPSQQTKERRPNLNYGIIIDNNYNIIGFEYSQNGEKKQELFSDECNDIKVIYPKGNYTWLISRDVLKKYYQQGLIKIFKEKNGYSVKIKRYLFKPDGTADGSILKSILTDNGVDVGLNADATRELNDLFYPNDYSALKPKPMSLVKLLIHVTTKGDEIVCDFFAGSGTTSHAVMKLNKEDGGKRKFILVEMGGYFDKVVIPKIKKVAYSFNWRNGKPQDADGMGGFFKYYELEQFEEALSNTVYENHDPFIVKNKTPCEQYIFLKDDEMLKAIETDYKNGKIKIDLNKLYPNIDIAETLSNLTGKWIKKIKEDQVEFEDGSKVSIKDLDYKLIKPLIWWE